MFNKYVFYGSLLCLLTISFSTIASPENLPSHITVTVVDGDQKPIANEQVEVIVQDDKTGVKTTNLYKGQALTIVLPPFTGQSHAFTVSAHALGYQSAAVKHLQIDENSGKPVSLMLVPRHAGLDMDDAHWQNLALQDPRLLSLLICNQPGPQNCSAAYEDMLKRHPQNLAALINISVALQQIQVGGRTAFSYYQSIGLQKGLFRDRFFAYVDKSLLSQLKANTVDKGYYRAASDTPFARLHLSWILHRHATTSFKELDLDRANVQITFNEKDTRIVNGIECVRVDTDIDYYRRFAHGFREVIPNLIMHHRTSPLKVFKLRWNATKKKQADGSPISDFDPVIGLKAKDH